MAANESLIRIEIKGSAGTSSGQGGDTPPTQPTQQQRPTQQPPEEPRRQQPRKLRGGNEEGDEGGAERPEPGLIAKAISTLIQGQIVWHIRQITGLFTGEQRLARLITQSDAFAETLSRATDKLSSIVGETFGRGGGEWVKNMGREVGQAFQQYGRQYRSRSTTQENRTPSDQSTARPMADVPDNIKATAGGNEQGVRPQNLPRTESSPTPKIPSVPMRPEATPGEASSLPAALPATGEASASGGGIGLLGAIGIGAVATGGIILADRLIGGALNKVSSTIDGAGDTLASIAATKILPIDRMFASALRGTGELVGEISSVARGVIKLGASIVEATIKIKDSLLARAEELSSYNGNLAAANVNRSLSTMFGDINEAGRIGDQLSRLVDAQTKMEAVGQELSTNFKEMMLTIIVPLMEVIAEVIKEGVELTHDSALMIEQFALSTQAILGPMGGGVAAIADLIARATRHSEENVTKERAQELMDLLLKVGQKGNHLEMNDHKRAAINDTSQASQPVVSGGRSLLLEGLAGTLNTARLLGL